MDDIQSVRVRKVLEDIVGAMNTDLRLKKDGSVVFRDKWFCDDKEEKLAIREIKDHSRELRVNRFGKRLGPFGTKHLEGLKWEVRVMNDRSSNAFYTTRGKIVVNSGLLKKLKSDDELATVIAHEVGHGVAQHGSDLLMKVLLTSILLVLLGPVLPEEFTYPDKRIEHLVDRFFCYLSRRTEMEADRIGLMLMALAGYDPRAAPKVFEEKLSGSDCGSSNSTHPTGKKRANKLRQPKVMNKAVEIYKETNLSLFPMDLISDGPSFQDMGKYKALDKFFYENNASLSITSEFDSPYITFHN